MKKIVAVLILSIIGYVVYAWSFLAGEASRPVLSIVTDDSYTQIPNVFAKVYLHVTGYSIATGNIEGSPSIPYLATGYDLGGFKNDEVLTLIDRFLENGADVNAHFQGYTALNGAILANSPDLVVFLLERGASTDIRVQREGIKHCNGLASLDFALCIDKIGKQDLSKIVTILRDKT